jgi:hypothetical protein
MKGDCTDPLCDFLRKNGYQYNGHLHPYGPWAICACCFGRRAKKHGDDIEHRPDKKTVISMLSDMKEQYWMPLQRRTVALHEENIELRARLAILEGRLGLAVVQKVTLSARLRELKENHPEASVRQAADQFGVTPNTVKKAWKRMRTPNRTLLKTSSSLEELDKTQGTVNQNQTQGR